MENSSEMEKKTRSKSDVKKHKDFKAPDRLPSRKTRGNSRQIRPRSPPKDIHHAEDKSTTKITDHIGDVSDDFSQGWTPYKNLAKKNIERQKLQLNAKKKGRHDAKNKHSAETGKNVEDCLNESQDSSKDHVREKTTTQNSFHGDHIRGKKKPTQASSDTDTGTTECITCNKSFPKHTYTSHVGHCLREKFERKGTKTEPPTRQKQTDFVLCQICQEDITGLSTDDQMHHVNDCLDGKRTAKSQPGSRTMDRSTPSDIYRCGICSKDLTRWTAQRRAQHLNRCIDQIPPEQAGSVGDAANEMENTHKNAARPQAKTKKKKSTNTGRNTRGSSRINHQPTNRYDEATLLALALSESLQEDRKSTNTDPLIPDNCTQQANNKNAFSILMSPKAADKNPKKRQRKKERSACVPDLVTTTSQQRQQRLEQKLSVLLPSQESSQFPTTPNFPSSRFILVNSSGGTDQALDHCVQQRCSLWELDSKECPEDAVTEQQLFYVNQLFPQVVPSLVKAGSKIKKMINIPGWEPIHTREPSSGKLERPDLTVNQTMFASTQTAVLLAELVDDPNLTAAAADLSTSHTQHVSHLVNESMKQNKTVHFNLPLNGSPRLNSIAVQQEKSTCQLETDFEHLLLTGMDSDFSIMCRDDSIVPAHTLFLKARCPAIIEASSSNRISLPSYSETCIRTLLKYIYTGKLFVSPDEALQVKFLAEMFNLPLLSEACKGVGLQTAATADVTMSQDVVDRTLQNFLHDMWSGDSDSDSAASADNHDDGAISKDEGMDSELDDLYEFVASQKKSNVKDEGSGSEDDTDSATLSHVEHNKTTMGAALLMKLEESFMLDQGRNFLGRTVTSTDEGNDSSLDNSDQVDSDNSDKMEADIDGSIGKKSLLSPRKTSTWSPTGKCTDGESALAAGQASDEESVGSQCEHSDDNLNAILGKSLCSYLVEDECADLEREDRSEMSPEVQNSDLVPDQFQSEVALCTPPVSRTYSQDDSTPDLFGCSDQSSAEDEPQVVGLSGAGTPESSVTGKDQLNSCITSPDMDLFESFQEPDLIDTNRIAEAPMSLPSKSPTDKCDAAADGSVSEHLELSSPAVSAQPPSDSLSSEDLGDIIQAVASNINCDSPVLQKPKQSSKRTPSQTRSTHRKRLRHSTTSSDEGSGIVPSSKRSCQRASETSEGIPRGYQETTNTAEQMIDLTLEDPEDGDPAHEENSACDKQLAIYPETIACTISPRQQADRQMPSPEACQDVSGLSAGDRHSPGRSYDEGEVWDQFDDAGAGLDSDFFDRSGGDAGVLHFSLTPKKTPLRSPDPNLDYSEPEEDPHESKEAESPTLPTKSCFKTPTSVIRRQEKGNVSVFDPPTDMDTDVSMALHDAEDSILWKDDNVPDNDKKQATPAIAKPKVKKRTKKLEPPSPFTPMANYSSMVTPQLKKACQEVGVRALTKKKMVVVLTDIYKRTHQYETDSDYESSPQPKVSKAVAHQSTEGSTELSSKSSTARRRKPSSQRPNSQSTAGPKKGKVEERRGDSDSSGGLSDTQDLDSSGYSQNGDLSASQIPEESILVAGDHSKDKKISKKDVAYKKKQIWDFIKENPNLYQQMLHYEPLDLNSFHQQLKESGHNIGVGVVMDFLDEQNVQFTMKNQATSRRKNKKKSRKNAPTLSQRN